MFTIYVDDSGTSPDQRIAVAAALVVPDGRIGHLESEWCNLREKYCFTDLHAAECAARNEKSQFVAWSNERVAHVFRRTCDISKKYAIKAISYGLKKADYEEALTEEWKKIGGRSHYTWAVRSLIRLLRTWREEQNSNVPLQVVFDWPDKKSKEEIERVMAQEESAYPGHYEGHFDFKRREQLAGLQCVDLLAWSCLQGYRKVLEQTPVGSFAEANFRNYASHPKIDRWIEVYTDENKEDLIKTFRKDQSDDTSNEQRRRWFEQYKALLKKAGRSVPR
jgi:hypothetical protein